MSALLALSAWLAVAEPETEPAPLGLTPRQAYVLGGTLIGLGAGVRGLALAASLSSKFDLNGPDGTYGRLIGGGLAIGGLAATAHASFLHGTSAEPGRQGRPAVGWTLFGVGTAVVIASRFVPLACFDTPCAVATGEATTWGGFVLAGAGLNLATFSFGTRRRATVAPTASGIGAHRIVGLTVSGRF